MQPVFDSDVLLLIATTLASKKKPASLADIFAAMELLGRAQPPHQKLSDAFSRLGEHGLIEEVEGGFRLSAAAQEIMGTQPRKADMAEQTFSLKEKLMTWSAPTRQAPVQVDTEALAEAAREHAASVRAGAPQLLMPIRSKETDNKRAAPKRRPPQRRER